VLAGRPSAEDDDLHYLSPLALRNLLAISLGFAFCT
jgi:hypothetical protein